MLAHPFNTIVVFEAGGKSSRAQWTNAVMLTIVDDNQTGYSLDASLRLTNAVDRWRAVLSQ